jgi:hypothetical protein
MLITLFSHLKSTLPLSAKQRKPNRVYDSVLFILELSLSAHLSILIKVLSPPGFRVSLHVSSSSVHLHIVFVLQAHRHVVELLLAVEHVPKEALVDAAVRELHHWLVAFASEYNERHLASGMASSESSSSRILKFKLTFQVLPSVIGGRVLT